MDESTPPDQPSSPLAQLYPSPVVCECVDRPVDCIRSVDDCDGDAIRTKDLAKDLHSKNLDYIQQLIIKNKEVQQKEVLLAKKQQRLKGKLAKQVLGEAYDKLRASSIWLSQGVAALDDPPEAGPLGDAADDDDTGRPAEAGSDVPKLPAIHIGRKFRRRSSHPAPGERASRDEAPPGHTSPAADCSPSGRTAGPPAGLFHHLSTRQLQDQQAAALQRYYGPGSADYVQWRIRNRIPDGTRVFCMSSPTAQNGIRVGLLQRGWVENTDHESNFFDLKWAVASNDIDYGALRPGQVVNHFGKASCITTKAGLCRTIRELAWYEAADFMTFYPRGYDLSDSLDRPAFIQDARQCAAEAVLKRALTDGPTGGGLVDVASLRLALRACLARLAKERSLIDDAGEERSPDSPQQGPFPSTSLTTATSSVQSALPGAGVREGVLEGAEEEAGMLSEAEWQLLLRHRCLTSGVTSLPKPSVDPSWLQNRRFITCAQGFDGGSQGLVGNKGSEAAEDGELGQEHGCGSVTEGEQEQQQQGSGCGGDAETDQMQDGRECTAGGDSSRSVNEAETALLNPGPAAVTLAEDVLDPDLAAAVQLPSATEADVEKMSLEDLLEAGRQVLEALSALHVQTHMDGMNNVWIVKPAGKSRGRGIRLFNDLDKMWAYIRGEDQQLLESRWVAQKYVERPLIIRRRKFDIRQWVLVTDWNPLTCWFYQDCYLRFCADDYDPNNLDIFLHLSNNSIAKHYDVVKNDDITAGGNMWTVAQFKEWLGETCGDPSLWESLIQPAMKHIVICTTKCAQDMVTSRKSSCQLYGYDFLIDDQLRLWLLEVNSSPTMEASTDITTRMCAEVQEDILKVVVDLPTEQQACMADGRPKVAPQNFDTGKFECLVGGGCEVKAPTYIGLKMEVKGHGMQVPQNSSPARPLVPSCYTQYSQALQAVHNQQQQQKQAAQAAALQKQVAREKVRQARRSMEALSPGGAQPENPRGGQLGMAYLQSRAVLKSMNTTLKSSLREKLGGTVGQGPTVQQEAAAGGGASSSSSMFVDAQYARQQQQQEAAAATSSAVPLSRAGRRSSSSSIPISPRVSTLPSAPPNTQDQRSNVSQANSPSMQPSGPVMATARSGALAIDPNPNRLGSTLSPDKLAGRTSLGRGSRGLGFSSALLLASQSHNSEELATFVHGERRSQPTPTATNPTQQLPANPNHPLGSSNRFSASGSCMPTGLAVVGAGPHQGAISPQGSPMQRTRSLATKPVSQLCTSASTSPFGGVATRTPFHEFVAMPTDQQARHVAAGVSVVGLATSPNHSYMMELLSSNRQAGSSSLRRSTLL